MTLNPQIVAVLLLAVANRLFVATEFSAARIRVAQAVEIDARLAEEFQFEARAGATETT